MVLTNQPTHPPFKTLFGNNMRSIQKYSHHQRIIKSKVEIDLMRAAAQATSRGVLHAMAATKVGRTEGEVAAVAEFLVK